MSDYDDFWTMASDYDASETGEENLDESSPPVTLPFCVSHPKLDAFTVWISGTSRDDVTRKAQEMANACSSAAGSACSVREGQC